MSTGAVDRFEVDLEELAHVVDRMAACGERFHQLLTGLAGRVEDLHVTWDGRAATAQAAAQAEWERGFAAMTHALAQVRAAAGVAHDNYRGAAHTNLEMWQQVG
jgi:WXG100 family type VII secretion target